MKKIMPWLRNVLFALLAMLGATSAHAGACSPTARIATFGYPGAKTIHHGNNLIQPAGKAVEASGQKLILRGQLQDVNCVPITQAVIEIWQLDAYGKRIMANRTDLADVRPVFTGSGRTFSGTSGEFTFITAFPGAAKGWAPRIHLLVKSKNQPPFSTQLLLGGDVRNTSDRMVKRLKSTTREGVTLSMSPLPRDEGIGYYGDITITLPYKARYDRY